MYELFEKLLNEKGVTAYRVSKETHIGASTFTDWKTGRSEPKIDKLKKIADYFQVDVSYFTSEKQENAPDEKPLTPRDEKDICAILSNTEELLRQPGLMFDGNPASQEAIDSILSAMQIGMEMAKKKNKELYTPKKYKKEQ